MKSVRIAPLVEGDGEVEAVPVLLRRVVREIDPDLNPIVPLGFRHPSGSIRRAGGLERAINAVAQIHADHFIVVLIDSDDDCPKDLGAHLVARAVQARPDLHVSIVLANREYEAWFLAAAESLAGTRNFSSEMSPPPDPEEIRNAKGWLNKYLPRNMRYSPTQDQAALSQRLDLQLARTKSRSFRKLWNEIEAITRLAI